VIAKTTKHRTQTEVVVVGRATLVLPVGQSKTIRIRLSAAGKRLLARRHGLKARLTVTQVIAREPRTISTNTITFKPKKKH
jgi:hypothetical protein